MDSKLNKEELIKKILENTEDTDLDDEEIMHLLITKTVSKDIIKVHKETLTFGDRMADKLAQFAGSWTFIISFSLILLFWIICNTYMLLHPFDPYPFILLNLVLSCIAALQAPVIMMSQNRQEEKDRLRAKNDYKVNLKSELIVEDLHKKLDLLMENQEIILKKISDIENRN
jgi:uncharacterized membrane protein